MSEKSATQLKAFGLGFLDTISLGFAKKARTLADEVKQDAKDAGDRSTVVSLGIGKIAGEVVLWTVSGYALRFILSARWAHKALVAYHVFATKHWRYISGALGVISAFEGWKAYDSYKKKDDDEALVYAAYALVTAFSALGLAIAGSRIERARAGVHASQCKHAPDIRSAQAGKGYDRDAWNKVVDVKKGKHVFTLNPTAEVPGDTPRYFFDDSGFKKTRKSKFSIHDLFQVHAKSHHQEPYRKYLQRYEFVRDAKVCASETIANPRFGFGGGRQFYVDNPEVLRPIGKPILLNDAPATANGKALIATAVGGLTVEAASKKSRTNSRPGAKDGAGIPTGGRLIKKRARKRARNQARRAQMIA